MRTAPAIRCDNTYEQEALNEAPPRGSPPSHVCVAHQPLQRTEPRPSARSFRDRHFCRRGRAPRAAAQAMLVASRSSFLRARPLPPSLRPLPEPLGFQFADPAEDCDEQRLHRAGGIEPRLAQADDGDAEPSGWLRSSSDGAGRDPRYRAAGQSWRAGAIAHTRATPCRTPRHRQRC